MWCLDCTWKRVVLLQQRHWILSDSGPWGLCFLSLLSLPVWGSPPAAGGGSAVGHWLLQGSEPLRRGRGCFQTSLASRYGRGKN